MKYFGEGVIGVSTCNRLSLWNISQWDLVKDFGIFKGIDDGYSIEYIGRNIIAKELKNKGHMGIIDLNTGKCLNTLRLYENRITEIFKLAKNILCTSSLDVASDIKIVDIINRKLYFSWYSGGSAVWDITGII